MQDQRRDRQTPQLRTGSLRARTHFISSEGKFILIELLLAYCGQKRKPVWLAIRADIHVYESKNGAFIHPSITYFPIMTLVDGTIGINVLKKTLESNACPAADRSTASVSLIERLALSDQ
jgi:hypothetical protein